MKFVAFSRDWADEFTVYGFALMTTEEWNDYQAKLTKCDNLTWYFGTNEGYDDERGYHFLEDMEVSDVTPEEVESLKRIFKLRKSDWEAYMTWGHFPEFREVDTDGVVQDEW